MRVVSSLFLAAILQATASTQSPALHHKANFEAERKQADDLFSAKKELEALPLYEDLDRQDPSVGLFAERTAAGLFAKEATISDSKTRLQVHLQGVKELKRAVALGDNSVYVRTALDVDTKTLCIHAADAGIRSEYAEYRSHLFTYVNTFLQRDTPNP